MSVKRIVAANMQQGLKIISQELGPDAVILSNKRIAEGVEILASVEDEVEQVKVTADIGLSQPAPSQKALDTSSPSVQSQDFLAQAQQAVEDPVAMSELLTSIKNTREKSTQQRKYEETTVVQQQKTELKERENSRQELVNMQAEIASLKNLLSKNIETPKTEIPEPSKSEQSSSKKELTQRLSKMGFGESYIKELLVDCGESDSVNNVWANLLKRISSETFFGRRQPLTHGGIWSFVGPTGGGKTTTLGKIAAQFVMKNNAESVAIISLDTFRIGAQEQLKVLSKILGVEFYSVTPQKSLQQLLNDLSKKKLILVDTGGCEKGMKLYENQLHACQNFEINNVLVAPATCQGWLLNHWYDSLPISEINCMAITKIDESPAIGAALSLSHSQELPLLAWCDGQNIPDDISFSQINRMINSAVSLAKKTNIMKQNDFFAA